MSNPPNIPRIYAVTVLTIAISIPICVAVRKKTVGFINGDEIINAITALNGIPAAINERPIGIAAYVGNGEIMPTAEARIIEPNSLFVEKRIFLPRKYRRAVTFNAMLMRRYGPILKNRSKKSTRIRKV
jgi:hypothetical protein